MGAAAGTINPVKQVTIYTDGACIGNPGPGGYGTVLLYNSFRKELSAGYRLTTNNRMELLAAIAGLEALKQPCSVVLCSDSRYLVENFTSGAAQRWRANGWMRDRKSPALNVDLWQRLLELCTFHQVSFLWVKGHAGNAENEICDKLSGRAARSLNLPADENYEKDHPRR
jgi:ribonuclease HI